MGEDMSFTNREIVSFHIGDFHQTVESWAHMVQVLLTHLVRDHRTGVQDFAKISGQINLICGCHTTGMATRRRLPDRFHCKQHEFRDDAPAQSV